MSKLCSKYIRQVKAMFPILGKEERKYIKTLKITLEDYLENATDISLNDLYNEFGNPNDIVNEYYNTVDTEKIVKRIKISKYTKFFIGFIVLCLLVSTIFYCCILYKEHKAFMEESFISTEEIIIE